MKKTVFFMLILNLFFSNFSAYSATNERTIKLKDGTEIKVTITKSLSSASAAIGQPIEAEVKEDIIVDNYVLIKKGTLVKGAVSTIEKAKRMGKGGNIGIQLSSVRAIDEQKLSLRSAMGRGGKDKTGSTIALTVLISPLFLLKKGSEAGIRKGTEVKAYIDEDYQIKSSLSESDLPKETEKAEIKE